MPVKTKPGRPRTPTPEEYIAKLQKKSLEIPFKLYPAYEEDRLIYDWLVYRRESLGEYSNQYLRNLVVSDMKLHLNEMIEYKAKREALLEELS